MDPTWSWQCPDCGVRIHVPLDVQAIAEAVAARAPLPPMNRDDLMVSTARHVAWNPERHPSFVDFFERG